MTQLTQVKNLISAGRRSVSLARRACRSVAMNGPRPAVPLPRQQVVLTRSAPCLRKVKRQVRGPADAGIRTWLAEDAAFSIDGG